MTHKNRKKSLNFTFSAGGFSCSLDFLYEGLGISKLQFLMKKIIFSSAVIFSSIFCHQTLDPGSMNSDPQHWYDVSGPIQKVLIPLPHPC